MSALTLDKKIARKQRGVRLRKGDAFVRSGRLLRILSAEGAKIEYEFSDGRSVSEERQQFLSRALSRVSLRRGDTPTNASMAASIVRSKVIKRRAKLSLLRGLVKNSSGAEKSEIESMLSAIRSRPDVS